LNESILTVSGAVLGFSIAFLSKAEDLESSLLLKEACVLLRAYILLNVFTRVVSTEHSSQDRIAALCWRFLAPLSAVAFISGLGLVTALGLLNV